jgi:transposase
VEHIAIDLGKMEAQVCRRSGSGEIVEEKRIPTNKVEDYLRKRERARVIVETCSEAFEVADAVLALGHEVRVVPSKLAPSLGVGSHGIKTDRRDAQKLSEASVRMDLGSVHIPSKASRERKAICGLREALVVARTQLINSVRGYLRTRRMSPKSGAASTFPERVRRRLSEDPKGMPLAVERQLVVIESLNAQIAEADQELSELAEQDETCRLLMTMPGVGPLTSVLFQATIDDVSRFPNGHRMESYLGLTPGEDSSSTRKRLTSITKAGPTRLRWVLGQAAWSLWRTRPNDPLVRWAEDVAKRRGRKVAVVALERRMAGVLRAMWRDGKPYDPTRAVPPPVSLPPRVEIRRMAGQKAAGAVESKRNRAKASRSSSR